MTTSTNGSTRKTNVARIGALETSMTSLLEGQAQISAMLEALLGNKAPVTPASVVEAPVADVVTEVVTATTKVSMSHLRAQLKAHKAAGAIKAGVTAKEAIAQGLMLADGSLPGTIAVAVTEAVEAKKAAKPAKAPKAPKVEKTEAPKGIALRSKTLPLFVEANPWAAGMKVREVAEAIVKGGKVAEGGFVVGERYRNLVLTGSWDGTPTEAPVTEAAEAQVEQVVAATAGDEPAWGSAEWIAQTHPREKDTPRRADGKATPKSEWPLRIALLWEGMDRFQIDAAVATVLAMAEQG